MTCEQKQIYTRIVYRQLNLIFFKDMRNEYLNVNNISNANANNRKTNAKAS